MLVPAFLIYLYTQPIKTTTRCLRPKACCDFFWHENLDAIIKEEELDLIRNSQSALLPKSLQNHPKPKRSDDSPRKDSLPEKEFVGWLHRKKICSVTSGNNSHGILVKLPVEQLQLQLQLDWHFYIEHYLFFTQSGFYFMDWVRQSRFRQKFIGRKIKVSFCLV